MLPMLHNNDQQSYTGTHGTSPNNISQYSPLRGAYGHGGGHSNQNSVSSHVPNDNDNASSSNGGNSLLFPADQGLLSKPPISIEQEYANQKLVPGTRAHARANPCYIGRPDTLQYGPNVPYHQMRQ